MTVGAAGRGRFGQGGFILQQVQDERMGAAAALYRHSRVSGNPVGCRGQRDCLFSTVGIPAYAGMTVGAAGNDGWGGRRGRFGYGGFILQQVQDERKETIQDEQSGYPRMSGKKRSRMGGADTP